MGHDDAPAAVSSPSATRHLLARMRAVAPALSWRTPLLLGLLFILAFGIRLSHADGAPLEFHEARQYRSLIIARDLYFDFSSTTPDWQREVARVSRGHQGVLEPPIMEFLVASGWHLLGGEQFWVPRLLSSVFWLVGGGFVYLIVRRIADPLAALFGVALYLFLPFAVVASRSFQPDPLMVGVMMASVWSLLRHHDAPSNGHLIGAAVLSGLAFTVQPRSIFVIAAVFLALAFVRNGVNQRSWGREVLLFGAPAVALPAAVYGYALLTGAFRTDIAQAIFLPELWFSRFFWGGWLFHIGASVGLFVFFGGLLGALNFRPGTARGLVLGLWVGYFAFGLVFNFAVATHDYYHLQLVPIAAISSAPILALVMAHLAGVKPLRLAGGWAWGVMCVALVLMLMEAQGRIANPDWQNKVEVQQEIGAAVEHSTRTVYLSADYGLPLEYHGLLAGSPWPLAADLEWERLAGIPVPDAQDRYHATFRGQDPEYFIIEDLRELDEQADLREFLAQNYAVLAEGDGYLIYDLRRESS